jgi:hypothetical protein
MKNFTFRGKYSAGSNQGTVSQVAPKTKVNKYLHEI